MITVSDNVAATSLFYFGGGCTALTLFNTLIPTRHTEVGCETPTYYGWGNTTTTAADQVAIVRAIRLSRAAFCSPTRGRTGSADGERDPRPALGRQLRPVGHHLRPAGLRPPGAWRDRGTQERLEIRSHLRRQDDTCPWQVNSIGWVQGEGRDYVLAVLTTDDPAGPGTFGFDYGITTIQGVSQRIWDNLAPRSP